MAKGNKLKSLIFIKSTVVSLGVILLVLIAAFFMLKLKRDKLSKTNDCNNSLLIEVDSEIEKMELQGNNNIVVLTRFNRDLGTQEIIKFDSNCGKIISRSVFHKANERERNGQN